MDKKKPLKHLIPFLVLILLSFLAYFFYLHKFLSLHMLKKEHDLLLTFVHHHPILAPFLFIITYIAMVSISLPVNDVMGIASGFLFPFPFNMIYGLTGAVLGAIVIFTAGKGALNDLLERKAFPVLKKMNLKFQKNSASYLLFLRLIAIVPFWLVNIASALFQVRFWTFLWTTFIGMIPITYVHVEIGRGLEKFFDSNEALSFHTLLNTQVKVGLLLLAVLALLPIFFKRYFEKRSPKRKQKKDR